eukprot:791009-Prorocentrum_minimum.AAC.1
MSSAPGGVGPGMRALETWTSWDRKVGGRARTSLARAAPVARRSAAAATAAPTGDPPPFIIPPRGATSLTRGGGSAEMPAACAAMASAREVPPMASTSPISSAWPGVTHQSRASYAFVTRRGGACTHQAR